jgi:quercetin 2,3-dioxygenase
MNRKSFLVKTLLSIPAIGIAEVIGRNPTNEISSFPDTQKAARTGLQAGSPSNPNPFVVDAGKSRFGEVVKFLGVHPNDLKISSKDTDGQLSMFDYVGLAKVGPMLHIHFKQDEVFTVIEGSYRFVVGTETHVLGPGQTIFLPRGIAHTWIQLTDRGRMIYFLQPAGKMEEFFLHMNNLKAPPSKEEMDRIHAEHDMKVVGPPLSL